MIKGFLLLPHENIDLKFSFMELSLTPAGFGCYL